MFSHPSKLELIEAAHQSGYTVAMHVILVPVELSVLRVAHRVASGGHAVPEGKIRERYERLWPLVVDAIGRCDTARVWDNSRRDGPEEIAMFVLGQPVGGCRWPQWAPSQLPGRWPVSPSQHGLRHRPDQ